MNAPLDAEAEADLRRLEADLLGDRPPALRPEAGAEAFRQHKILASAIHRAARLHQRNQESETNAWVSYLTDFFPEGRNGPDDARVLFGDWRTPLLKDNTLGPRVVVTHGQSVAHWSRDESGATVCIDLESLWDDFTHSVQRFLDHLRGSEARRRVVLARWRQKTWEVGFLSAGGATAVSGAAGWPSRRPT